MAYHKKTRTPYRALYLKGRYQDFDEFYDTNKEIIYKKIIETFEGFAGTRKKVLSLYIQALIKGLEWDSEFVFYRDQSIVLTRDVMPFFEQKEDYETCIEIRNLYERLTNKKTLVTIE
jgi:hypothetical protein